MLGIALSFGCNAQSIDSPVIKPGDTWTYRTTVEKGAGGWTQTHDDFTVSRVTPSSVYYSVKQSGSTLPQKELIMGSDWSRRRDVNGTETVVSRPLSFPLQLGKTWDLQYTEQHPNKAHKFEKWDNKFTVVGFESVEVPAGQFKALKIESEGSWAAELEPNQTLVQGAQSRENSTTMVTQVSKTTDIPVTGRTYKAYWYVPEVKRWVKYVEEYYTNGGVRNERYTGELESFKLAE